MIKNGYSELKSLGQRKSVDSILRDDRFLFVEICLLLLITSVASWFYLFINFIFFFFSVGK